MQTEIAYKVLGTDGQEYGPVNLEELRGWLAEGRVTASTQVWRNDVNAWRPAAGFSELGLGNPSVAPAASAPVSSASAVPVAPGSADEVLELNRRVRSGGSWFYWIAGLSLINSIVALTGSGYGFIVGLSITQIFDHVVRGTGEAATAIMLALDVLAAGVFAGFGVFACKRQVWAFIVGMTLYGIDTLLTLAASSWLGVAFHVWVLVSLFTGLKAALKLNAAGRG
jgi:hypothetical protein